MPFFSTKENTQIAATRLAPQLVDSYIIFLVLALSWKNKVAVADRWL
jgi:hypothetical protein